jgi:hypothetical protein
MRQSTQSANGATKSSEVSGPVDQMDLSHRKPPQFEHDEQPCSGRVLPSTLTVSQRGPVTLLRLSRPDKRNALDLATTPIQRHSWSLTANPSCRSKRFFKAPLDSRAFR